MACSIFADTGAMDTSVACAMLTRALMFAITPKYVVIGAAVAQGASEAGVARHSSGALSVGALARAIRLAVLALAGIVLALSTEETTLAVAADTASKVRLTTAGPVSIRPGHTLCGVFFHA